jgi:hypothetical protein
VDDAAGNGYQYMTWSKSRLVKEGYALSGNKQIFWLETIRGSAAYIETDEKKKNAAPKLGV